MRSRASWNERAGVTTQVAGACRSTRRHRAADEPFVPGGGFFAFLLVDAIRGDSRKARPAQISWGSCPVSLAATGAAPNFGRTTTATGILWAERSPAGQCSPRDRCCAAVSGSNHPAHLFFSSHGPDQNLACRSSAWRLCTEADRGDEGWRRAYGERQFVLPRRISANGRTSLPRPNAARRSRPFCCGRSTLLCRDRLLQPVHGPPRFGSARLVSSSSRDASRPETVR
jgi:hypothetical protein